MQIHNTPTPTRADNGILPALMLLVLYVHLLHVLPVFLVLVFLVGADDGETEPGDRAEFQGYVAEVLPLGFVLLVGGFGHVGAAVL